MTTDICHEQATWHFRILCNRDLPGLEGGPALLDQFGLDFVLQFLRKYIQVARIRASQVNGYRLVTNFHVEGGVVTHFNSIYASEVLLIDDFVLCARADTAE